MTAPNIPTLEPILRLGVTLGVPIDIGGVPTGERVVIPILGGAAPGPTSKARWPALRPSSD